ncbi:MAG: cation:proton antiporter [Gammaproteobacteria bacterium]|nr:cation:proton antiporter [Gammaproteobacteria bacterium]
MIKFANLPIHLKILIGFSLIFLTSIEAWASSANTAAVAETYLWLAVLLLFAKISGLVEKLGQTAVLGELLIGVLLGNLYLLNINIFESVKSNTIIAFLAELGVVILLFEIGLESNVGAMRKVGMRALLVACIGVAVPFALGTYLIGPWLLPGLSDNAYLILGATLTATSVGITARVFSDLHAVKSREAQIVLGAAVIDDVLGLIILAVVSAVVTAGSVGAGEIVWITLKAVLFLFGALAIGQRIAPLASRWLAKVHAGSGMKFSVLIAFCLMFAWLAGLIGLAPIVGAFAAGLVLDEVHFRDFAEPKLVADIRAITAGSNSDAAQQLRKTLLHHEKHSLQTLMEPIGYFFIPLFFVYTGMQVKLETFFNPASLATVAGITLAAIAGKLVAGAAAGPVNKWIVGWGMVPRGEVGLIFAVTGKTLGVVSDNIFSIIVAVVILTTLITPPVLTTIIRRTTRHDKL